jgi:RND family efflux transporter MFP subunit
MPSRRSTLGRRAAAALFCTAAWLSSIPLAPAQAPPPAAVRYTEAREHTVRRSLNLPGTVESRTVSLVASEVEGLVAELLVRDGDAVKAGQPLARLRTATLELKLQAKSAEHREAVSRLKLAERGLERARDLFGSRAISQQQLDESVYDVDAWKGRADKLVADIAQIELDLERSAIRAPFAGVVVARRTEVGEWIELGDPVVELLSLGEIEINVEVPERYFEILRRGSGAAVRFESLPGVEVDGRVSAIIPRADPQARTYPVKIRIPNRGGRIGVGMLAEVLLPVGDTYRATLVPKDAVVSRGSERVIYTLNGSDSVSAVPVKMGAGVGPWVVVEGAVKAGEKVVTRGNERLQPGQPVSGEPIEYPRP